MSNEINTVQDLWAKFGSGYWHNWTPTQCIVNNEIPKDVFNVAGSYGDTEAVKLDDISKKEVREWRYTFNVLSTTLTFSNTGGGTTTQVNSWKQEYVNGSPVGSVVGVPFRLSGSSSYSGFNVSVNTSNNTFHVSCDENLGAAKSGTVYLKQEESGIYSPVITLSQSAVSYATREDLYVRDYLNRWQWDYSQYGQAYVKNFDIVSEHVELRNGKVISTSKRDFNYKTEGDFTGYFYTGKDGTIVRCWPYNSNPTSQIRYFDIVLYRDGASNYRIMCQQNKQY